jgi:sugar/nucleoside kinase (ribokinase family)
VRIATLGDLLLDVIVRVDGPLAPGDDVVAHAHATAGGQAANVAAWARELGAEARFLGRRGGDLAGRLVEAELAARGVEVLGPASGRNGVVVSFVGADGDRSLASDRGVAPELRPDDVQDEWLDGCDVLHVAGYSLLRSPIDRASLRAASTAATTARYPPTSSTRPARATRSRPASSSAVPSSPSRRRRGALRAWARCRDPRRR